MTLTAAAQHLKVHIGTIRKWIRSGAPTLALGEVGRGHASEVDPEALQTWRAQRAVPTLRSREKQDLLSLLTTILLDTIKRDDLARCAHLTDAQAAAIVLLIYQRAHLHITRSPLAIDQLPPELRPFSAIVLLSIETGNFTSSRR